MQTDAIKSLQAIYANRKIAASNFGCKYGELCRSAMPNTELFRGRAAFVGSEYNPNFGIAVIAMDVGNTPPESTSDVVQEMETRRSVVEGLKPTNPHLIGTEKFLRILLNCLGKSVENPLSHCAMLNAAKCSRKETADAVTSFLYAKCFPYLCEELEALKPKLIWMQGSGLQTILSSQSAIKKFSNILLPKNMGIEFFLFEGVPTIKTWHPYYMHRRGLKFDAEVYLHAASTVAAYLRNFAE